MALFADLNLRPFLPEYAEGLKLAGLDPLGYALGQGSLGLEVLLVRASRRPGRTVLRDAWKKRSGGRAAPILLLALYGEDAQVAVCGPAELGKSKTLPVYPDLKGDEAERICLAALACADRHAALRLLRETLPELGDRILGVVNQGLLATHELQHGVTQRPDWAGAVSRGRALQGQRKQALLRGLGYEIQGLGGPVAKLVADETDLALGLFLNKGELVDMSSERFSNLSPVTYALARADNEGLPWVMVLSDDAIRLYPVKTGVGVGQRGRAETFVQLRLDLLSDDDVAYLWLLYSADALRPDGTIDKILENSRQYATSLGSRLRERIYTDVIPRLAESIAAARGMTSPTRHDLDFTYQMALTILFRLLFVAYAEDKGLLPYRSNEDYRSRSLNQRARKLLDMEQRRTPLESGPFMWQEVQLLFDAVDQGHHDWGIPPYNGGLFESGRDKSRVGNEIRQISLGDHHFGLVLRALLLDYEQRDDIHGPVDFRSLSVREFGTIYEGLLGSELSLAQSDLAEGRNRLYVPAKREKDIVVRVGEIYLHDASGRRKSTGSYYTKSFAVEHLLDHALEPALDDHLTRLQALGERASGDDFFDFRVADIAMGSGHFLVAAIDRIERRFTTFLADHPVPAVRDELERLRQRAQVVMREYGTDVDVEDTQLLRRQIARRCIYGVDLNPMAVDLARLSVWVHSFVPGLPLSLLDYNLVCGNSLVGIATLQEAEDVLDQGPPLWRLNARNLLGGAAETLSTTAQLADADAAEIAEARSANETARQQLAPTAALLDALAASRINEKLRQTVVDGQLIDSNKSAQGILTPYPDLHEIALEALQAIPPFHFPIAFPQVFLRQRAGFDVILGNPPWEIAKPEENRFWTRYVPGLHSRPQHEREDIQALWREGRPELHAQFIDERAKMILVRKVLLTGPFPGMGTGDPDLYKGFTWRFWSLISDGAGRMGVVLPRSVFSTKGASEFRRDVFSSGTVEDMTNLVNNRQWTFEEVHPQYTVTLFSLRKQRPNSSTMLTMRGPYSSAINYKTGMQGEAVRFPLDEVFNWTSTAALPLLPDDFAAQIFAQLRQAPNLDMDDTHSWRALPYNELHSTHDKKHMELVDEKEEDWWPVYKGESFDIWEPDRGAGTYYAWANPEKILERLYRKRTRGNRNKRSVYSELSQEWVEDKSTYAAFRPRIACRKITNRTNSRSIVVALIPSNVVAQDGVTLFIFPRGDEFDEANLLGLLSSIPLDWYSRRFVEINMNFHILNSLPVPRPARANPLWQRVVALSGRLAAVDERYADWAAAVGVDFGPLEPARKDDMIYELDAVVAHLYGLSADQLGHIFATFHVGWDYHARLRAVLAHFKQWEQPL